MKPRVMLRSSLLLLLLLLLSGCGIETETSIDVDSRYAGSRTMVLSVDSEDLQRVRGGADALIELLSSTVEPPLSYSVTKNTGHELQITFTLTFSGLDDYVEKCESLIALGESGATVDVAAESREGTLFGAARQYRDNVETKDLLDFIVREASSRGLIADSDIDKLWGGETASLAIGGEKVLDNASFPLDLDSGENNGPIAVYMRTQRNEDDTWSRAFALIFTSDAAAKLPQGIRELLMPDSSVSSQSFRPIEGLEDPDKKMLVFEISGATPEKIAEITGLLFRDKDNRFRASRKISENQDGIIVEEIEESLHDVFLKPKRLISEYFTTPQDETIDGAVIRVMRSQTTEISADREKLRDGFHYRHDALPHYQSIAGETWIDPDGTARKRSFRLIPDSRGVEELYLESLRSVAGPDAKTLEIMDGAVVLEYEGDAVSGLDLRLFQSEPLAETDRGTFGYRSSYLDGLKPKCFTAESFSMELRYPDGAKVEREEVTEEKNDGTSSVSIRAEFSGTDYFRVHAAILAAFILLASCIVWFARWRRLRKIETAENSQNTEKLDNPK